MLNEPYEPLLRQVVEKAPYVTIQHKVHTPSRQGHRERIQCLMRAASRPQPVGETQEVFLVNLVEEGHHGLLNDLVLQGRHDSFIMHLLKRRSGCPSESERSCA